jgi:hypothetical protein
MKVAIDGKPEARKTPDIGSGWQGVVGGRMDGRCDKANRDPCPAKRLRLERTMAKGGPFPTIQALGGVSDARGDTKTDANSRNGHWAGVRASIVAMKPANAGGAKGRREVDSE